MCVSWNKSSNYNNMHGATIKKHINRFLKKQEKRTQHSSRLELELEALKT